MKQRFTSREHEHGDARASGFSRLTKFMKATNRSTSATPTPYYDHNSLLNSRDRLQEDSSKITELSNQEGDFNIMNNTRTRTDTEFPNQEHLQQQQQPTNSSSSSSIRMYTCKTCGRKFESFQALGGHRASHKMKFVGTGVVGEDGMYQNFQYRAKLHRCLICDKGYQTGQALGGHMRKHRELLDNQRLAVAAAASNNVYQQKNRINSAPTAAANHDQSNNIAIRWAQMNAAANPARRYNDALHDQPEAGRAGLKEAEDEPEEGEILEEKVPTRKGLNLDLNLNVKENEELGLVNDEW